MLYLERLMEACKDWLLSLSLSKGEGGWMPVS